MGSHEGVTGAAPIRTREELVEPLARGARPAADWCVGTEYEKFAVLERDGRPLTYEPTEERPGIRSLLEELVGCCGWEPKWDGDALVALRSEWSSVTLEPGGQFEMSGAPLPTIHEMLAELQRHERELGHLGDVLPVQWLWAGHDPVHELDHIDWMPKRRYEVMRRYLPTRGRLARHMMQATCTVQANLDFGDEGDMGRKVRTAMGVSSLVTALFANSPFIAGRPSGYRSFRTRVWDETDPDRCGLLPWVFEGDPPTWERYVEWALKVPMFFIERDGELLDCAGLPFEDFLRRGWKGRSATREDWELHLSTLFPEIRVKHYLEMRGADCVKPALLPALPALWKGLLYDETARQAAWDLVRRWSFDERQRHRDDVARYALHADVPGARYRTGELARELLSIARHGLREQAERTGHDSEEGYLDPIEALARRDRCPADESLAWYERTRPSTNDLQVHYHAEWADEQAPSSR